MDNLNRGRFPPSQPSNGFSKSSQMTDFGSRRSVLERRFPTGKNISNFSKPYLLPRTSLEPRMASYFDTYSPREEIIKTTSPFPDYDKSFGEPQWPDVMPSGFSMKQTSVLRKPPLNKSVAVTHIIPRYNSNPAPTELRSASVGASNGHRPPSDSIPPFFEESQTQNLTNGATHSEYPYAATTHSHSRSASRHSRSPSTQPVILIATHLNHTIGLKETPSTFDDSNDSNTFVNSELHEPLRSRSNSQLNANGANTDWDLGWLSEPSTKPSPVIKETSTDSIVIASEVSVSVNDSARDYPEAGPLDDEMLPSRQLNGVRIFNHPRAPPGFTSFGTFASLEVLVNDKVKEAVPVLETKPLQPTTMKAVEANCSKDDEKNNNCALVESGKLVTLEMYVNHSFPSAHQII